MSIQNPFAGLRNALRGGPSQSEINAEAVQ